jgi:hydroxypyruvate isomerase
VTELRVQFMCEYRLHLQQVQGEDSHTKASITGEKLHLQAAQRSSRQEPHGVKWAPLVIALLAIVLGILWILG